jgi:hypothetical protein
MNEQFAAEDDMLARTMTDSELNELGFATDLAYAIIDVVRNVCTHYDQDDSNVLALILDAGIVGNLSHDANGAFRHRIRSALSGELTPRQQEAIKASMVAA